MIGFIGLGNMAGAIIGGIINEGIEEKDNIIGSCRTKESADRAALEFGIKAYTDNKTVAAASDVLFLAVKPQFIAGVVDEIKDDVKADALIISIVAGKSIEFLEKGFGRKISLVRTMPNTPALVGEGITGICFNDNVAGQQRDYTLKLFSAIGLALEVPENLINSVCAVSGGGPAFVFMMIEAMADGGVNAGLPRDAAYKFAAQTVLGSAALMLETGKKPGELKDMVCSPAGTTIEGVRTLEEKGFRGAVMDAVMASYNKSKGL